MTFYISCKKCNKGEKRTEHNFLYMLQLCFKCFMEARDSGEDITKYMPTEEQVAGFRKYQEKRKNEISKSSD